MVGWTGLVALVGCDSEALPAAAPTPDSGSADTVTVEVSAETSPGDTGEEAWPLKDSGTPSDSSVDGLTDAATDAPVDAAPSSDEVLCKKAATAGKPLEWYKGQCLFEVPDGTKAPCSFDNPDLPAGTKDGCWPTLRATFKGYLDLCDKQWLVWFTPSGLVDEISPIVATVVYESTAQVVRVGRVDCPIAWAMKDSTGCTWPSAKYSPCSPATTAHPVGSTGLVDAVYTSSLVPRPL